MLDHKGHNIGLKSCCWRVSDLKGLTYWPDISMLSVLLWCVPFVLWNNLLFFFKAPAYVISVKSLLVRVTWTDSPWIWCTAGSLPKEQLMKTAWLSWSWISSTRWSSVFYETNSCRNLNARHILFVVCIDNLDDACQSKKVWIWKSLDFVLWGTSSFETCYVSKTAWKHERSSYPEVLTNHLF